MSIFSFTLHEISYHCFFIQYSHTIFLLGLQTVLLSYYCMHLKFPLSLILILMKLNGFVVLLENRIRIILQVVFLNHFCFVLVISIFHAAFVSFCFGRKFLLSFFTFMHWRRKWQPTPVFLPRESQGQGSLVGCHLWGRTESDTTEATQQQTSSTGISSCLTFKKATESISDHEVMY